MFVKVVEEVNNSDKNKTNPTANSSQKDGESADKTSIAQKRDKTQLKPSAAARKASLDNGDKTRFAPSKPAEPSDNDKTRFAPSKPAEPSDNDKTRFAPSKPAEPTDNDKTRFAPSKSAEPGDNDETRFVPSRAKASADKTQFKPTNNRDKASDYFDGSSVSQTSIDTEVKLDTKKTQQSKLLKKRFILEKVLGAGGMGVVYKAKDLVKVEAGDKDPYVAIKVLTDEFKEHPEAFVALQRESRKTQRIAHPNIVNVHDFDKDKAQVFMTMEFLEGKPLDQLIRQYKSTGLPTEDGMSILRDLCQALTYAHEQKIIHSDFKPGNIFVTDKGVTKIFDFGIARAVAKAEHYEENLDDKTIFDAGDLGALTPAYASMEMLEGFEPDVRDDIYALGCVAYELFTGNHPFNKIPADEAQRQKLKPKKISHISRRMWKAIEKSLAFKREDRLASAEEFLELMSKTESPLKIPALVFSAALVLFLVYFQFFQDNSQGANESEIRNELEYTLRVENYRNEIDELLIDKAFTQNWENSLWNQVQGVRQLLESSEKWLQSSTNEDFKIAVQSNNEWYAKSEQTIYTLYLENIRKNTSERKFDRAQELIDNAYRYSTETEVLDQEKKQLQVLIAEEEKRLAEEQRKAQLAEEQAKLKKEQESRLASQRAAQQKQKAAVDAKNREFTLALNNVQEQLKCLTNSLNMRNLDTAIGKLRSVDNARYRKIESEIVSSLTSCITQVGKKNPERATEYKKRALRIFKNDKKLAAIKIIPRDPCDRSLAGLGARGKRATCKDIIDRVESGPDLVVIPGKKGIATFAIGKYETSIADMNLYCRKTKSCSENKASSNSMPVTKLTLKEAEKYLLWLSKKTGKKYRLPTKNEWQYAAKSKRISLDPNRNCKLNTRGITKGDTLVRTNLGVQNSWGLVNYVGNASEWVYDKGRKLVAVGGSYNISMEKCNVNTSIEHSGNADSVTGFRVLREIK